MKDIQKSKQKKHFPFQMHSTTTLTKKLMKLEDTR